MTLSHFTLLAVLRYGTNLGTALQLAQFRDDAASQERAVAGLGAAVQKIFNIGSRNAVSGVKYIEIS